ncbi:CoA-binding protein [Oceaniglobus ichthyenteri]|uniref:CoA-binding protein n=1 Tax=Oceaniglobus ichthyenteri TaxID=2136177 RepID=UPI000D39A072|nr:CoA-binding protein [Oceaniglobus ichthyenteri]
MTPSDDLLRDVFKRVKTIACVGASMKPVRPSHDVSQYLIDKGYRVYPVNPGHAGAQLFGETVVGQISDLPDNIDMIDIFRRSEYVPDIVESALARFPTLDVIWMQIGVHHDEAAARARARGVTVIENLCPKIEYRRLFGA